jgi:hypothetical protein
MEGLDKRPSLRTVRQGRLAAAKGGRRMWPEVAIRARTQKEVDCLLFAFAQAGVACLVKPGFCVEVGGATAAQILKAVQECLLRNDIASVGVTLSSGREHVLLRERSEA